MFCSFGQVLKKPIANVFGFSDIDPNTLIEERVDAGQLGCVVENADACELETLGSCPHDD